MSADDLSGDVRLFQERWSSFPPVRIYHEYFSQPTYAQLPSPTIPLGIRDPVLEPAPPPVGMLTPSVVGYTPPRRTPPTPITIPDSPALYRPSMMEQVAADARRQFDSTYFSREPVPNVFPGPIEPRTLFADYELAQAFDAGHIVAQRGR